MKINSLVFKTTLVSAGITLLALIVVLILSVSSSSKSLKNVIAEELMNKATMTGDRIDDFFEQRLRDVRVISQADVLESSNNSNIVQYFEELQKANNFLTNIWILEGDKKSIFGTKNSYSKLDIFPDQVKVLVDSIFHANQGDVYLTDAIQFEKGLSVFLLTPITDDSNINVVSSLIIQVDFEPIENMISVFNDNVIGDKFVYLLNDLSEVIATDDSQQPILETFKDLSVRNDLLRSTEVDGATGFEIYNDYYGVEVMAGMADMEAHGKNNALDWGIVAVAEISAIAAPASQLRDNLTMLTLIIAVIIVIIMSFFMRYSLIGVSKITEIMKTISKGDITKDVDEALQSKKDEVGRIAGAMNIMILSLRKIIQNISFATQNISSGSDQLSTVSAQIASGSNEQASSTEEVSASMEEMVANVNQNTENAIIAEKISVKAANGIIEGNESFKVTMDAMREIAKKITVIGDIAEKTDILAINAAIEAARAGEQGKGFAVVATEIRKLAENSQTAAQEIDKLVVTSVNIAEKSGKLLSEISPEIQKTSVLVQEIANAGNEQNSGANQINDAIQELTKVIQENTSSADEMAASSKNMSLQAMQLEEVVAFFKTTNTDVNSKNVVANNKREKPKTKQANKQPQSEIQSSGYKLNLKESDINDDKFEKY